ncbi:hypothetical protein SMJ63A_70171 [Stenotrophomonas geniculata]|nr:protein of unknown function [Stenotrophomonas maltophilia]
MACKQLQVLCNQLWRLGNDVLPAHSHAAQMV